MSYEIGVVGSESVIKILLLNSVMIFFIVFPVCIIETVSLFTSTSSAEAFHLGK